MKFLHNIILALVSLMWYKPKAYDTAVATGSTLSEVGAVALRKIAYDSSLNEPDATLDDIWNKELTAVVKVDDGKIQIPNDVFFQVPSASTSDHTIRLQATRPLQEAPRLGEDEHMPGNEEQLRLLWTDLRYNEIKKAVSQRGWGVSYNDMEGTGVYKTINPKFKYFWAEYRGLRIRKASMLSIEDSLTKTPIELKQQFCANIFVCNNEPEDMPVWDITDLTNAAGSVDSLGYYPDRVFSGANSYVESIAAKMLEGSGTSASPQAYMGIEDLDRLDYYLQQIVKMPKISVNGEMGYLFVVPQAVYSYMSSMTRTDGFGPYFQDTYQSGDKTTSYWGRPIRYKSLFLICDSRGPTLTVSGSEGSYTLQPGFVNPGDNDDRNMTAWGATSGSLNYVFEVGFVYGRGALAERVVIPAKYVNEIQAYGYLKGRGSYLCGAVQTVKWDVDTPDDANDSGGTSAGKTLVQKSLCMVLMSRIPLGTLRSTS